MIRFIVGGPWIFPISMLDSRILGGTFEGRSRLMSASDKFRIIEVGARRICGNETCDEWISGWQFGSLNFEGIVPIGVNVCVAEAA